MSVPRHKQLTRSLREDIAAGRLQIGERLPPEVELASQRGVSRATLRRALSELEAEGLVVRRKRVGTIVVARGPLEGFRMKTSSLRELTRVVRETVLEILTTRRLEGESEPLLQGRQNASGRWLEVTAVRRMPGHLRPFSWHRIFVAGAYAGIEPSLSRHRLASVFGLIEEMFDRPVVRLLQSVSATQCPAIAADAIGISPSAPAFSIETDLFSFDGELIQFSHAIYDPARFQLHNEAVPD